MRKKFITFSRIFAFAICFMMISITSFCEDETGSPIDEEDPVSAVPIDGGLTLLAAAGVAYGAKIVHARKKARQTEKESIPEFK